MAMNAVENFMETIRWGRPEELCRGFGPLTMIREPGSKAYDTQGRDVWGVTWGCSPQDQSGRLCVVPGRDVITDVERWREQLTLPDIHGPAFRYEDAAAQAAGVDRTGHLVCLNCTGGLFERAHFLMGFGRCLEEMLLDPEPMGELLDAIADVKIALLEETYRHTQFQAIFFHDDWGTKTSLFFSAATWEQLIRPRHQRIVDAVKALGDGSVIFIHHSDTFLEPLVPKMADMGIDVWQGCIPQNDIVRLQKELRGRIAFMGGIDIARIDRADHDEAEIRAEVRRAVDAYAPGGGFIPCVPNGSALYPQVQKIVDDELEKYCRAWSRIHLQGNRQF